MPGQRGGLSQRKRSRFAALPETDADQEAGPSVRRPTGRLPKPITTPDEHFSGLADVLPEHLHTTLRATMSALRPADDEAGSLHLENPNAGIETLLVALLSAMHAHNTSMAAKLEEICSSVKGIFDKLQGPSENDDKAVMKNTKALLKARRAMCLRETLYPSEAQLIRCIGTATGWIPEHDVVPESEAFEALPAGRRLLFNQLIGRVRQNLRNDRTTLVASIQDAVFSYTEDRSAANGEVITVAAFTRSSDAEGNELAQPAPLATTLLQGSRWRRKRGAETGGALWCRVLESLPMWAKVRLECEEDEQEEEEEERPIEYGCTVPIAAFMLLVVEGTLRGTLIKGLTEFEEAPAALYAPLLHQVKGWVADDAPDIVRFESDQGPNDSAAADGAA